MRIRPVMQPLVQLGRVVAGDGLLNGRVGGAGVGRRQHAEACGVREVRRGGLAVVLDSADIRANPHAALSGLCAALEIPFTDNMLHWPAGPKPYDGVWAPHWYNAVHKSTGFEDPEGDLPDLSAEYRRLVDQAMPHYERLAAYRL